MSFPAATETTLNGIKGNLFLAPKFRAFETTGRVRTVSNFCPPALRRESFRVLCAVHLTPCGVAMAFYGFSLS